MRKGSKVVFALRNLIEHIAAEPRNRDINDPRKQLFKNDPNFKYDFLYVEGIVEEIWDLVADTTNPYVRQQVEKEKSKKETTIYLVQMLRLVWMRV